MVRVFGGIGSVAGATLLFLVSPLKAQDPVLEEVYGQGVHAYFAGRNAEAYDDLSVAVNGGSKDPRVYYFRALADLKLGREAQAERDMKSGARLETDDVEQFYPVSRSLERVQGHARLTLERYRMVARAESRERQEKINALRYEQRQRSEEAVRRSPVAPAPAADTAEAPAAGAGQAPADATAGKATPDAATAGDASDPFGEAPSTPEQPAGDAAEMPADGEPAATEGAAEPAEDGSGFGTPDAKQTDSPAADASGGATESETPVEKADGAESKAPGAAEDPFGDGAAAPASNKAAPKVKKAAPKAKGAPPAAGDAGNPFGDDADQGPGAKKAKAPAAKKAPADDAANPFGQ